MLSFLSTLSSVFTVMKAAIQAAHDLQNGLTKHQNRLLVADALKKMNDTKGDTSALDALYNNAVPRN